MLRLLVDAQELFDEETQTFIMAGGFVIELEHSLLALSKWESKFEKPFLGQEEKTSEEILAYIEMMIVSPDPSDGVLQKLSQEHFEEIRRYVDSRQSATTFRENRNRPQSRKQTISAELIYFWMISYKIPLECETWHLNRLFSLLRICEIQNTPQKKRSAREIAAERRTLNEQRRAELGTRG
jgi:hypothetical protein